MPVPIHKNKNDNSFIDYSVLLNYSIPVSNKKVIASNRDAGLLFQIWSKGKRKNNKILLDDILNISSSDIIRLKTNGFLIGNTKELEFTRKGKSIITTMSLGEQNAFEKKKQPKTYTEILASLDKRGKRGYRIASQEVSDIKRFNGNGLNLHDIFGDK